MTPPGEPLQFNFGAKALKNLGNYITQFPNLRDEIEASIAEAAPASLTVIWRKKLRLGDAFKGMKASVEAIDKDGKHGFFEVFYVERGDNRAPVKVTQGTFDDTAAAEFCKDYDGTLEKKRG